MADNDAPLDVAVVGAGISGVYTAWRLRTALPVAGGGPLPTVKLFESSRRIGGRLLSLTPPEMDGIPCELGGMRFLSTHDLLTSVLRYLRLETVPMPSDQPENLAFLRGFRFRRKELKRHAALPYRLSYAEEGLDPGELLVAYALNKIIPGATEMSLEHLEEEARTAHFEGRPLYKQGFWNVLDRVLSNEGYALAMDASGYDCLTSNWNAADAIPFLLADFASAKYYKIVPGFDAVPLRLAKAFEDAGGECRLEMTLRSIAYDRGSHRLRLRFEDGTTVSARRVVLALPRRALELLEPTGVFDPSLRHAGELRALIGSVRPIPLFKLFLCYEYPWWRTVGVHTGRSVTDLPIRQCFYWAVKDSEDGKAMRGRAAMLASYDDERYTTFWGGLKWDHENAYRPRAARGLEGPLHPVDRRPVSRQWDDYLPPRIMVEEAHRQLVEMHGLGYAPLPYTAAFQDWQVDPYGGGVHFWKSGVRSWEVESRMLKPVADIPLFVCGEAYSRRQGWVEGALSTAEGMLQEHFHLPAPKFGAQV